MAPIRALLTILACGIWAVVRIPVYIIVDLFNAVGALADSLRHWAEQDADRLKERFSNGRTYGQRADDAASIPQSRLANVRCEVCGEPIPVGRRQKRYCSAHCQAETRRSREAQPTAAAK